MFAATLERGVVLEMHLVVKRNILVYRICDMVVCCTVQEGRNKLSSRLSEPGFVAETADASAQPFRIWRVGKSHADGAAPAEIAGNPRPNYVSLPNRRPPECSEISPRISVHTLLDAAL